MKTLLLLILFLAIVWMPVLFRIYSWQEGLIMTISLSLASWMIDKYVLNRSKKKDTK